MKWLRTFWKMLFYAQRIGTLLRSLEWLLDESDELGQRYCACCNRNMVMGHHEGCELHACIKAVSK